jgi:hypothetical protein
VQELADEFERFEIQHIPREENWKADALMEQAFSNGIRHGSRDEDWRKKVIILPLNEPIAMSLYQRKKLLMSLLLIFLFALTLRAFPYLAGWPITLPLNGGGLYYQFSINILEQGMSYPWTIDYYTANGLPFAYPPLMFFLSAILSKYTPLSLYQLHIISPPIISALAIFPTYFLFSQIESEKVSIIAAAITAVSPFIILPTVAGEGFIEATAILLVPLAGAIILICYNKENLLYAIIAGFISGVTILATPGGALGLAILGLLISIRELISTNIDKIVIIKTACIAILTLAVSSIWWGTVIHRYGLSTLLNGLSSKTDLLISLQQIAGFSIFSQESFVFYGFAFIGLLICYLTDRYFLLSWIILYRLMGEINYLVVIPGALISAIVLVEFIWPSIKTLFKNEEAVLSASKLNYISVVLIVVLLIHSGGHALSAVSSDYTGDQDARANDMSVIRSSQDLPPDAKIAVIDPVRSWWLMDWAPAISKHTVVNTPYGSEWTGEIDKLQQLSTDLNNIRDYQDLRGIMLDEEYPSFNYIYIDRDRIGEWIFQELSKSEKITVVYENEGAAILRISK